MSHSFEQARHYRMAFEIKLQQSWQRRLLLWSGAADRITKNGLLQLLHLLEETDGIECCRDSTQLLLPGRG